MNTQDALSWIAEVFEEPADRIRPDTARDTIPGWDSLGTLTLLAALDEKFDIHPSDAELDAMSKVEDILVLLRRQGALAEA